MGLDEDLAAVEREIVLSRDAKMSDFVKIAWDQVFADKLQWNWHIDLLCDVYTAAMRGEIRRLVVNIPPNSSKSALTCVLLPCFEWARNPNTSFIFGAYGDNLILRDARLCHKLWKSDWWRARFADRFTIPTVPAMGYITNDKGGFRFGTTPGGQVTGFHANVQIIDDPNKPEDVTDVGLQDVKNWRRRTLSTRWRKPPHTNCEILIMQRLHENDLSAQLLEEGAVHVCLPANYDPARRTVTTWGSDPRMVKGEVLDVVRLPQTLIDELTVGLGPINAAAQLQQSPAAEGGSVFQRAWLRHWTVLPERFDEMAISVDCAFKEKEDNDFVAIQCWGRIGPNFYLVDQICDHYNFPDTLEQIAVMIKRWPQATTKLIEDKANGPGVIAMLKLAVHGIIEVDPRGGKLARAHASTSVFNSGNVWLPPMDTHPWVVAFMNELTKFPRDKHDDQVDACTQALLYLAEHVNYLKAAMEKVRQMLLPRVD